MRPRLTQLSLAVIMELTNIILVYCPPLRGLMQQKTMRGEVLRLLPPIAGIDVDIVRFAVNGDLLPPIAGIDTYSAVA